MCPLGEGCPKLKRQRWPNSSIRSVTNVGAQCPYAHHLMELEFPESYSAKLACTKNQKKKAEIEATNMAIRTPFYAQGPIQKKHTKHIDEADFKAKTAKLRKICLDQQDTGTTTYFAEMKEIDKKMQIDDNYCKKFGYLKKASVLMYYGRENEAFNELANAAQIVQDQKKHEATMFESIQKRWRMKLGLDDGFEIPFPFDKMHPDQIDYKKLEAEMGTTVPISTVKMFVEHVSPHLVHAGSKDEYLNECIKNLAD